MTDNKKYVLDANVFITANRQYYSFELAPKFWDSLVSHAKDGRIESIDRIKNELERGKDDLSKWAKGDFSHYFASTDDDEVIESYREIMGWVNSQRQFTDEAKAEFAGNPDGWLVAYAKAKKRIIVTHEVLAPYARNKIKIPNICQAFNVPFVNVFEMLRSLKVKFD